MKIFYLLFVVKAVVQFQIICSIHSPPINRIEHFPPNLEPQLYELTIHPYLSDNDVPFRGDVRLTINCKLNTDTVILNVKELKIIEKSVTVRPPAYTLSPTIEIKWKYYVPLKDQYVIILTEELKSGHQYEVSLSYIKDSSADLSDRGYIRYGYRKELGQPRNIVALTRTEINDARRYFPCMDEMSIKSSFRVQVALPHEMVALGSTDLSLDNCVTKDGVNMCEFEETNDRIATHSLSLILAKKLKAKNLTKLSTGMPIVIWSDEEISDDITTRLGFLSQSSVQVFNYYMNTVFDLVIPCDILNILGLPEFQETHTEKYGVLLLEESTLTNSEPLDDDKKADILMQLCYGICRQWLGASATMKDWNEYWVQQALATFLRGDCVNKLLTEKESDPLDWHLVEAFTHVLRDDGESVSRPVHVDPEYFDLTEAFSDSVLLDKAELLIRTMHYFLGNDDFLEGVKVYYSKYINKNSNLNQVWESFNENVEEKLRPYLGDRPVEKIMDSWSRKKGYPLITMEIEDVNGDHYTSITQERFVQLEDEENIPKTVGESHWIIPLSYLPKSKVKTTDEKESPVDLWLLDKPITHPYTGEWILLNLRLNVLCRVNYPEAIWSLFHDTLMEKDEYSTIPELSRVQLIVDMFALAEVNKLQYTTLLNTIVYIRHEYSDIPLMVALQELNKIRSALYGSDVFHPYRNYVKEILESIFERPRFKKITELQGNRRELELKKLVIELSCEFGVSSCVQQAKDLFQEYYDAENEIPEPIRSCVYCQGIKHGGSKEWSFLKNKYQKRNADDINKPILTALGCTKNEQQMSNFLHFFDDDIIPPQYHLTIISGLAANELGYKKMMEFFLGKVKLGTIKTFAGYENTIGFFMVKLFEYTNSKEEFNELKGAMNSIKRHLTGVESLLRESIRIGKRNYLWRRRHENTLRRILTK